MELVEAVPLLELDTLVVLEDRRLHGRFVGGLCLKGFYGGLELEYDGVVFETFFGQLLLQGFDLYF